MLKTTWELRLGMCVVVLVVGVGVGDNTTP